MLNNDSFLIKWIDFIVKYIYTFYNPLITSTKQITQIKNCINNKARRIILFWSFYCYSTLFMIWILNHFPFKTAFYFLFSSFKGYIIYDLEIAPLSILKPRFSFQLLRFSLFRPHAQHISVHCCPGRGSLCKNLMWSSVFAWSFEQAQKNLHLEERVQVLQQQNEDLMARIDRHLSVSRSGFEKRSN